MQTVKLSFEGGNLMVGNAAELSQYWHERLAKECPEQRAATRKSIVCWLLGRDLKRFELLEPQELEIAKQAIEYRWIILRQRYLGIGRERAYRNLITRLASVVSLRSKIQSWVALSSDRQRTVLDVLQEIIQELLQSDTYMQQQMSCIAEFTTDKRLRDALLLTSVEEYTLRPIRNQPLLVYRFVNYLRRTQRGGLTQVPVSERLKIVSEEIFSDDGEHCVNLVDTQAIAQYQEAKQLEEQQLLRQSVQTEFANYLRKNLGQEAVDWLRLYLQGKSADEITKQLNKPIREIYRLREKVSYHAVRVFALKDHPELVDNWLSISLQEHNLGLTPSQWQQLYEELTPIGQQVLTLRKAGNSMEAIAQQLKLKTHQAMGEWTKVFLASQALRHQKVQLSHV
jgi:hypothetical protein